MEIFYKILSGEKDFLNEPVYILILIIVALIFNMRNITEFFYKIKRNRTSYLEEALNTDLFSGEARKFLKDELTREYFYLSTGLNIDHNTRSSIIKLINDHNDISLYDIKRSIKWIKIVNNRIHVKISFLDKIGFIINFFLSIMFILLGSIFLIIIISVSKIEFAILLKVIILSVLFIAISIFHAYESSKYLSIKKLLTLYDDNHG